MLSVKQFEATSLKGFFAKTKQNRRRTKFTEQASQEEFRP